MMDMYGQTELTEQGFNRKREQISSLYIALYTLRHPGSNEVFIEILTQRTENLCVTSQSLITGSISLL